MGNKAGRGSLWALAALTMGLITASCFDSSVPEPPGPPPPSGPAAPPTSIPRGKPTDCRRWVAPEGDDSAAGTRRDPWATMEHALAAIPESGCTVQFLPGTYRGARIDRHFTGTTVLRSAEPYQAVLVGDSTVLDVQGAFNVTVEGFEIHQEGSGSTGVIVNIEQANDIAATWIDIRNNVIHDSFEDDLLKIRDAARHVTVSGNVFYNQASGEQHIDVNGVRDVTIEGNIFSNDFAATGRTDREDTKAYVVIKDSSGTGELGSRRVRIRRNVLLNWQGGRETLVQVGNDGKEYFEAADVTVENNLVLGNSPSYATATFAAAGVKEVAIRNNTVVGDLPFGAFAVFLDRKGSNPPNQGIELHNNVFADPTGTMGDFINGDGAGLTLDNNLYWNAGERLDEEGPANPDDDENGVVADPLLEYDHGDLQAVIWDGAAFPSGTTTIGDEFVRLVEAYAVPAPDSPVVDAADPATAPPDDILGRERDSSPDLGAYEREAS